MFDDDTTCGSFEGSSIPARWHDYGPDARILRSRCAVCDVCGRLPWRCEWDELVVDAPRAQVCGCSR